MTDAAPAGLDLEKVSQFFATQVPGGDVPLRAKLLSGGKSNITYLIERDGGPERSSGNAGAGDAGGVASGAAGSSAGLPTRCWVLRRPPLGHVLPTAHDMAREYRVLSALADTDVPVPRPYALCEDTAVNGAPFYVMEYKPGIVVDREIPPELADSEEKLRKLSVAVVQTLARLHRVDFVKVGLGEFGRPQGFLPRQLKRWGEQWLRSKTRELPAMEDLAKRLAAALPESPAPSIVHGDYRLGNMVIDPTDPGKITAILDWEMATIGDPLADLGWLLVYWGQSGDPTQLAGIGDSNPSRAAPGLFTRDQLIEEYARSGGPRTDAIDFYQAFALYKLAVISEGIHARFLMGKTLGEGFSSFNPCETLVRAALDLASRSSDPRLSARSS